MARQTAKAKLLSGAAAVCEEIISERVFTTNPSSSNPIIPKA